MPSNKALKKALQITGIALLAGGSITQGAVAFANSTNDNDPKKDEKAQSVPQIDYSEIDKDIKSAKDAGMKIDEKNNVVEVKSKQEAERIIKSLEQKDEKQRAELKKQIAAFNEWNGQNTGMEGVSPQDFKQQLDLKPEPRSVTSVKVLSDDVTLTKYAKKDWPKDKDSASVDVYWDSEYAYVLTPKKGTLLNAKGPVAEITYDNLQNSTYQGKKITKMVKVLGDATSERNWSGNTASLWIAQDPTEAFYLRGGTNSVSRTITKMYDADGKEITLGDDALVTYGSLNAKYHDKEGKPARTGATHHREHVTSENELYKLEGSSISVHGKTAYAEFDNEPDNPWTPEQFKEWDSPSSKTRVYGSVIGKLKIGQKDTFSIHSDKDDVGRYGTMWVSESTTLPPANPAPTGTFERTEIKLTPGETTPITKSVVTENWDEAIKSTKKVDTGTSDKTVPVDLDKNFGYVMHTTIDESNEEGDETSSFKLNDTLDEALSLDSVQVVDLTDDKDITEDFETDGKVTSTLKSDKLKDYKGHEIEWRIGVHVDPKADLEKVKQEDGSYVIKNVAQKIQNDTPFDSNDVLMQIDKKQPEKKELPKVETPIEKAPNTGVKSPLTQLIQWIKSYL